ncbi:UDP-N-acetylmuramoyl-tripeptide--D-alanyl-D-alanine ligase [Candidatus Giovannonibacteria bacterium]|nr:UDP-N-acetylmuramoyl-tripeptide--D-alanyl-D-alanine ligase [Candidatus Giovannonibacteria bacterium]
MKELLKKIVIAVLTWEARQILKKYKPRIVAITGSVGKTSAKDAIAKVLEYTLRVRKSQKSYNSEFGVPLAIIGAESGWSSPLKWLEAIWRGIKVILFEKNYPKILVLEVGADRPGDIRKIRSWLNPDVAVITALAETPVHVEFFSGPEEVWREKAELVKNLGPQSTAILNFDDEEVAKMRDKTSARILTFGLTEGADIKGAAYGIFFQDNAPAGIEFEIEGLHVKILNALGKHQALAALAAIAVGKVFDIKLEDAAEALSLYSAPLGRLKLIKGIKDALILDDTYNSSPKAALAALEVLDEISAKRKVAVLGDMLELGKHTITEHRRIGELAANKIDLLITVGIRAKFFAEGATKAGFKKKQVLSFGDSPGAARELEKIIEKGDLILIKGSQGMRMEKITEAIMSEPERAPELLCRQDEAWGNR